MADMSPEVEVLSMTFERLHHETGECKCTEGMRENTTDFFARRIHGLPPTEDDFKSKHEEKKPYRGKTCGDLCHYRGVSVSSLSKIAEEHLKQEWADYVAFKPKLPRNYCKFKIKASAGVIWPSDDPEEPHCELLKSDNFKFELLEIIEYQSLV